MSSPQMCSKLVEAGVDMIIKFLIENLEKLDYSRREIFFND